MSFLETLTRIFSPSLHKSIREKREEQREKKHIDEYVLEILKEHGYRDYYYTGNEKDWDGNHKKYPVMFTPNFKQRLDGYHQFDAISVTCHNTYYRHVTVELLLVDRREKKLYSAFNSGQRGIHYEGNLFVTPLSIRENEKHQHVSVAYQIEQTRRRSLKERNVCIAEVDVSEKSAYKLPRARKDL